jgi:hypothetical protein
MRGRFAAAFRALIAQLIGGSLLAYCGAKGSPQPPLPPPQQQQADGGSDGGAP